MGTPWHSESGAGTGTGSGSGQGTKSSYYEDRRDGDSHSLSRSRANSYNRSAGTGAGTGTNVGTTAMITEKGTPASSRNPPQRYVCEIELPAYLDPKSPYATKTVWGIGVPVNGLDDKERQKMKGSRRHEHDGEIEDDVKEESMDVDHEALRGVVSSAVERYISPPSNSPSRAGTECVMDVDSQKSLSGSLSPPNSHNQQAHSPPSKKSHPVAESKSPKPSSFTFSTTNQFTSPLPLYEWTLSSVYKDEVLQGSEAVWMALMGRHFDGDGGQNGDASGHLNGTVGVRYDYVTEVLPSKYKKLLRPGTGVGMSSFIQEVNRYADR